MENRSLWEWKTKLRNSSGGKNHELADCFLVIRLVFLSLLIMDCSHCPGPSQTYMRAAGGGVGGVIYSLGLYFCQELWRQGWGSEMIFTWGKWNKKLRQMTCTRKHMLFLVRKFLSEEVNEDRK